MTEKRTLSPNARELEERCTANRGFVGSRCTLRTGHTDDHYGADDTSFSDFQFTVDEDYVRSPGFFDRFILEREQIERLRLIVPRVDGQSVLDALHADGYRTVRSGPYADKKMFPKVDPERMLFIVDKVIDG